MSNEVIFDPTPAMNVTILADYQDAVRNLDCFKELAGHNVTIWNDHVSDLDVLSERLEDAEALVLIRERTPINAALVDRLEKLRLISLRGSYPHVDVEACTRNGVIVSSAMGPGQTSYSTAELTWALILAALRHVPQEVAALKAGQWQTTIGTGLRGRTLGIFGYGDIGTVVAGYGQAFGMNVLVWGREGSLARAIADGHDTASGQEVLFETSDVLTLHVRLVEQTRGVVTRADLARMKPTALFVNTSRAALVEPGALVEGLRAGRPGMAAVDVYEEEPLVDGTHELLGMPNVVCTPHLGYVEIDAYEQAFRSIFEQILAYDAGTPINVVNPDALTR